MLFFLFSWVVSIPAYAVKGAYNLEKRVLPIDWQECCKTANEVARECDPGDEYYAQFKNYVFEPSDIPDRPQVQVDPHLLAQDIKIWFLLHKDLSLWQKRFLKIAKRSGCIDTVLGFGEYLCSQYQFKAGLELLEILGKRGAELAKFVSMEQEIEGRLYEDFTDWLKKKKWAAELKTVQESAGKVSVQNQVFGLADRIRAHGKTDDAEALYGMTFNFPDQTGLYRAADMFVDDYNALVANGVNRPSANIFRLLNKASACFERLDLDPEAGSYWAAHETNRLIEHYTWWYVHHPQMVQEIGEKGLESAFSYIRKNQYLISQIINAKTYSLSESKDLATILSEQGFVLAVVQSPKDERTCQHIWVNELGVQVRIKPKWGQFSIGMTQKNPLIWKKGKAVGLEKSPNGSYLIDDPQNEIFKVSKYFLIPAFNNRHWDRSLPVDGSGHAMSDAHLQIGYSDSTKVANRFKSLTLK